MTPLGLHLRQLRDERGLTQKDMASAIGVSPAYLSALEHGHRGKPSWALLQRIVGYLNIIWDDAEELQKVAGLSDPRVIIDTTDLSANATRTANLLAQQIDGLDDETLNRLTRSISEARISGQSRD